jgi:phage terminase large subunit-like protein
MTSSTDPATAYALAVVAGDIPAGRLHRMACARHLADLDASPGSGYVFDWPRAEKVVRFFRLLRHFKGTGFAGKRIELLPFQVFIVASLFGWLRVSDGLRRFRNAFIELPRGNGKSTLLGGLGIWLAFFDKEASADVLCVATKKDQARIVFDAGRQMVMRAPAVQRRGIEVQKHALYAPDTASKFAPLGSDVDTLDGLRPHGVLADEVHKYGSGDLIDVLESGMGTRQQPMLVEITTAGDEDSDSSVYGQHFRLSDNVLTGDVALPEWFAFIAAADLDDDWQLETTWRKANPAYGVSVLPDFLDKEARKAIANPQEQPKFRRLYLGQRVGADERYVPKDAWAACASTMTDEQLQGLPCLMGLDYSSKVDLTALVLLWMLPDGSYYMRPTFWMPAANIIARQRRDRVPYASWAEQGFLELIPGPVIEQPYVRQRIVAEAKKWGATEIDFDPWNASELARQLTNEDGLTCVEIRQGTRTLSEPTKRLLELVLAGRIHHPDNPLMNWMTANVRVKRDGNENIILDKLRSRSRIDGPAALVNALSRGVRLGTTEPEPAYQLIVLGGRTQPPNLWRRA